MVPLPPKRPGAKPTRSYASGTTVLLATLVALALAPTSLRGQELLEAVVSARVDHAEGYLGPVFEGLGRSLTSGPFDRARVLSFLQVDASLRVAGVRADPASQRFTPTLPSSLTWRHPTLGDQSYPSPFGSPEDPPETPTATGSGPGLVLEPQGAYRAALLGAGLDPAAFSLVFPAGLDISLIPSAMAQLAVGIGLGSELTLRYLPASELSPDLGRLSGEGMAFKHSLSQWFLIPLDVSLGLAHQRLAVEGFFEATAREGWLLAGGSLGPVDLFAGAGLRRSTIDVAFSAQNPLGVPGRPTDGSTLEFSFSEGTQPAWSTGVRFQLLLLNVGLHYTGGEQAALSLKLGVAIP
jgi:hypothetical protein